MIEVLKIMKKPLNSDVFIVSGSLIQIQRILNYSGYKRENIIYLNMINPMKVDLVFIHENNERSKVHGNVVSGELQRLKLPYFNRVMHWNSQMLQVLLFNGKLVAELHKEKQRNPYVYIKYTNRIGSYFIRSEKGFSYAVHCTDGEKIKVFNTNFNAFQTKEEELQRLSLMENYKRDKIVRECLFEKGIDEKTGRVFASVAMDKVHKEFKEIKKVKNF